MRKLFVSKLKESILSVSPIVVIVVILSLILGFDFDFIFKFVFAGIFVVFGLALFTLGADISMIEIGQKIGGFLAKKNWLALTLVSTLILGVIVTIAEPDLIVLSNQLADSIEPIFLIGAVAIGVGLFMVISILRTKFNWPLNIVLIISYALIFILAFILPEGFVPLALDSGSVTTGPVSVPFIMAFGIGLATVSAVKGKSSDNSFGTVALVSAGPILAVMILGIIMNPQSITYSFVIQEQEYGILNIILHFFTSLPNEFLNVLIIVLPILVFFLIFQFSALKLPFKTILQIFFGFLYVFIGITFFLSAVNFGFLSTGQSLGLRLGTLDCNWVIIPLFALIGLVIVLAEPAVHVLTKQIESVTSGVIKKKTMFLALCIGVSMALILVAVRMLTNINILFFAIPLFALCFILSFIAPKIFTGISFDSGGVVTGAMSTTFVLPMIIGAVHGISGDAMILIDAFGSLALVASSPILSVFIIGVVYKKMSKRSTIKVKTKKPIIVEFN